MSYYSFNNYLKQRFAEVVWRVTLEGGFSCPNRDGVRAFGGCTFCTADGSSSRAQDSSHSIREQLHSGIAKQRIRHKASKFIAYLQSFTNTYASVEHLGKVYDQAIDHPDVVMLAIGTRPDCLADEVIKLIDSYTDRVEVWLDLGLQSIHNHTLKQINRAHTSEEFFEAIKRIKALSPRSKICAHMIAGLPGEDKQMILQTAQAIAQAPVDGIKIHNLCVLKGTKMAADYQSGEFEALAMNEYIGILLEILSILPENITIHRLMGEAPSKDELIAPSWASDKNIFLSELREKMKEQNIIQGCKALVNS